MAKLLFSGLVDGVRGRTGGIIFSANSAGPFVRRFNPPIYKNTAAQVARRSVFSSWGGYWSDLSPSQRNDWNTYAADGAQALTNSLGNTYYLNGWQWFVSCNSNLALVNRSPISDAPVLPVPPNCLIENLVVTAPGSSGNQVDVNVAGTYDNDLVFSMMWTRGPSNLYPNIKNFKVVLGVQNADIVSAQDLGDLTPIFGNITAGSYWVCLLYCQTIEGRSSVLYPTNTVSI
jgi:hypothetical protein